MSRRRFVERPANCFRFQTARVPSFPRRVCFLSSFLPSFLPSFLFSFRPSLFDRFLTFAPAVKCCQYHGDSLHYDWAVHPAEYHGWNDDGEHGRRYLMPLQPGRNRNALRACLRRSGQASGYAERRHYGYTGAETPEVPAQTTQGNGQTEKVAPLLSISRFRPSPVHNRRISTGPSQ